MTDIAQEAVERAASLLEASLKTLTRGESKRFARIARLIQDPSAKTLSMVLTDRLFRSSRPARAAAGLRNTLNDFSVSDGFSIIDRLALFAGGAASRIMPGTVLREMRHRLRNESEGVILPAEDRELSHYLNDRKNSGARANLNQLGEAILGEEEAARRLDAILALLARPDVNYISVKISAIFSQINLLAWDETLRLICERLRRLYRAAMPGNKLVNLDMEEYRDLELTLAALRTVLDEPEFQSIPAGVVLQAYLPDSWKAQHGLTEWARARVAAGGAPIKLRLVKGANHAMETVEAELHDWNVAPYTSKADTDANFKRMLEFACQPENARVVRVGVGSHNLFDIALALVLRDRNGVADCVEIEMLEGMANHQARAVEQAAGGVLLYAPIVKRDDFASALAYLIRRLDENTSPQNFLHDLFGLTPGGKTWEKQRKLFLNAWENRNEVGSQSHRASLPAAPHDAFHNEPDSDWTQAARRASVAKAIANWQPSPPPAAGDLNEALELARTSQPAWEAMGDAKRAELLHRCADVMAAHRDASIACLRAHGKKAIWESDAEISEAIDFARYYALQTTSGGTKSKALGIVAVTPPWNFPFAIPCGGVLAALMAGNAVIFKPAPEVVEIAWWLVRQLWEAGIPRDVLQFFPCDDGEVGQSLIRDPRVNAVVLTGGYETARMFQAWRPSLTLYAETSGKNAIVVSALADRDLAVKDIVRSAFGHSGQKCSAASLAILEAEVYDDPNFHRQLRDAAASLRVGPATDPASMVVPLIREPGDALRRALTELDPGESWLLEPKQSGGDPCQWSPGIRSGVKRGSWFHQTECFGPVLGLMRAENLDEAMAMQNEVAYGLTAGIHSLDEREIARWRESVQAGNLYINRPITGAIVQRQPFGGWKRSSIGPGSKAGGPNYVNLFRQLEDAAAKTLDEARADFHQAWQTHFSVEHDPSGLKCEGNVFRYRPCRGVILRLPEVDAETEALAKHAAETCGVRLEISRANEESDAAFAARIAQLADHAEFVRTPTPPSDEILRAIHAANLNWINAPLSTIGRLELTRWLREQAVSETRHRYGNIIFSPDSHDPLAVKRACT